MKNPLELAEEYCIKTSGFVSKQDRGTYLAGYEAAHSRAVYVINEELKRVQSLLPDPEFQAAEYILKFILKELDKD